MKTSVKSRTADALRIFACALPMMLFCLMSGRVMLPFAAAVFIHEGAHLLVLLCLHGRLRGFSAAPFGMCMEIDESSLSLGGEAAVAAAGAAANLVCTLATLILYRTAGLDLLEFGIISLLTAALNLLPMEPLDGGRMLFIALSALRGPFAAARVTAVVTHTLNLLVFLTASYLLITAQNGLYAVLFSMYIFTKNAEKLTCAFCGEIERI